MEIKPQLWNWMIHWNIHFFNSILHLDEVNHMWRAKLRIIFSNWYLFLFDANFFCFSRCLRFCSQIPCEHAFWLCLIFFLIDVVFCQSKSFVCVCCFSFFLYAGIQSRKERPKFLGKEYQWFVVFWFFLFSMHSEC